MQFLARLSGAWLNARSLGVTAALVVCALSTRAAEAGCGDYLHYVPHGREAQTASGLRPMGHDRHEVRLPYVPRKCNGPACNPGEPAPTSSSQMLEVKSGVDRLLTVSHAVTSPDPRVSKVPSPGEFSLTPGYPSRLHRPPRG